MIPVVTMNDAGELSRQVFNDNLSPAEQINRKLLTAIYKLQDKLTNGWTAVEKKIGSGELTTAEIDTLNTQATAVLTAADAVVSAMDTMIG